MRGYAGTQNVYFPVFSLHNLDLCIKFLKLFFKLIPNTVNLRLVAGELTAVNEEMRGRNGPKMLIFLVFRSVILTNDQRVTFYEWWRKLLWLRLIWDILQANRPVNKEMRGYTEPLNADFPGFSIRGLDLWLLGQVIWWVNQTAVIAVNLRHFANKLTRAIRVICVILQKKVTQRSFAKTTEPKPG